ncbi:patatin-like phospholipase family protein [Actinomycetota bacterium]
MWGRKKKVGIALSGGAARGLAHIGVLEVLEELGVEPVAISGTSMGSIIGSFYCSGISLDEMEKYVGSMDWKSFLLFSDLALSNTGIINGRRIERVLKGFLEEKTFSDCTTDFCCVAVDVFTRKKEILASGKLLDAVRASISIPGFFSPICLDGKLLVDGGLIEPLPTESIKIFDVNFIIGSSITFERDSEKYKYLQIDAQAAAGKAQIYDYHRIGTGNTEKLKRLQDLFKGKKRNENQKSVSVQSIIDTSLNIMHQEMARKYNDLADIVIEPEVGDFGFFDLTRGSEIIKRGREAAEAKASEIKRKLRLN